MRLIFLIALSTALSAAERQKDWTKLVLNNGPIRGRIFSSSKNRTAYLFLGIPYAEPPIGNLRYRAPIDAKKWSGELNATEYRFQCMSTKTVDITAPNPRNTSEDCLYVNVFTTENCLNKRNCPVMYYVYGGQWNYGSPFNFPHEILVENFVSKDIVLVTVAYRLGSFGFFNTGKKSSAVKNLGLVGNCALVSIGLILDVTNALSREKHLLIQEFYSQFPVARAVMRTSLTFIMLGYHFKLF